MMSIHTVSSVLCLFFNNIVSMAPKKKVRYTWFLISSIQVINQQEFLKFCGESVMCNSNIFKKVLVRLTCTVLTSAIKKPFNFHKIYFEISSLNIFSQIMNFKLFVQNIPYRLDRKRNVTVTSISVKSVWSSVTLNRPIGFFKKNVFSSFSVNTKIFFFLFIINIRLSNLLERELILKLLTVISLIMFLTLYRTILDSSRNIDF